MYMYMLSVKYLFLRFRVDSIAYACTCNAFPECTCTLYTASFVR